VFANFADGLGHKLRLKNGFIFALLKYCFCVALVFAALCA
jgi:hypothetical protein